VIDLSFFDGTAVINASFCCENCIEMAIAGMNTIKYRTTNDVGITGADVDAEKMQLNIVNVNTMLE
jgi:allophanate hydrolase subunit 2